ncbi:MAG: hypothetical protein R3E50_17280 [Halioglobus sp.]
MSEPNACAAVRQLAGVRFLLRNVPRIPVADCTCRQCNCYYRRYSDRRNVDQERRAVFSLKSNMYATHGHAERRVKVGRRAHDAAAAASIHAGYDFTSWDD